MIGCHVSILSNLLKFVYSYSNSYDGKPTIFFDYKFILKGKNKIPRGTWKKRILHLNPART